MALIVEDGTGKPDAESYISVAEATTYHSDRGNAAWALLASDTAREQLLRKSTEYMVQAYRLRWLGSRTTDAQRLDWPRAWVALRDSPSPYAASPGYVANNVVPSEVKAACAELALSASTGALAPNIGRTKSEVQVGEIAVKYDETSSEYTRYRAVDMMLGIYLNGSGAMVNLVRT